MTSPLLQQRCEKAGIQVPFDKVMAGERLSEADGLALYRCPDIHAVGALANHVRERIHGDKTYFNVNQHINYTNVVQQAVPLLLLPAPARTGGRLRHATRGGGHKNP